MSYRRFMTRCVVCVLCVKELDHADLQPEANSILNGLVPYAIMDKSLVFTN